MVRETIWTFRVVSTSKYADMRPMWLKLRSIRGTCDSSFNSSPTGRGRGSLYTARKGAYGWPATRGQAVSRKSSEGTLSR
jgi:hypothetical protein